VGSVTRISVARFDSQRGRALRAYFLVLVTLCVVSGVAPNTWAASKKEEYELQERCGQQAKELFNQEYSNRYEKIGKYTRLADFRNHYNIKLNKCIVVITERNFIGKPASDPLSTEITILDLNENRKFGWFLQISGKESSVVNCDVADEVCHSRSQWELLIEPYMSDAE
jgi:hypothetical protein